LKTMDLKKLDLKKLELKRLELGEMKLPELNLGKKLIEKEAAEPLDELSVKREAEADEEAAKPAAENPRSKGFTVSGVLMRRAWAAGVGFGLFASLLSLIIASAA